MLDVYLKEIANYPTLTSEQENELIKKALNGDKNAKNTLIASNLKLVVSIAKHYQGKGLPLLDLIQEGSLGLMTAIDKFDISKGYKLSTYAGWWVRHYINRALSSQSRSIRLPSNLIEDSLKLNKIKEQLQIALEREPTAEELKNASQMPIEKINKILENEKYQILSSIDAMVGESDSSFEEITPDMSINTVEDNLYQEAIHETIFLALDTLTEREKFIMIERFGLQSGEGKTLEDIGKELKLSKERVRQLEEQSLRKLRNPIRSKILKECFV